MGIKMTGSKPKQSIDKTPVVICPGFGNDSIDYETPLGQSRDIGLVSALERRGFSPNLVQIVPVRRVDWARVAGGLLDPSFYRGEALPTGKGYGWYVQRVRETIDQAYMEGGGEKVLLLGHSAGGWLARAAMGDGTWNVETTTDDAVMIKTAERVACIATFGAIHKPPEDDSTCVTRGALDYVNCQYPGAFLRNDGVGYVTIGSNAILGDNSRDKDTVNEDNVANELYATRGEGSVGRVAYTAYKSVCGRGDVMGDGVVPLDWTQLDGARQIRLDGVLHSINEAGTTMPTDRWYGSEGVIDRWLPSVLEEAGITTSNNEYDKSNYFDIKNLQNLVTSIGGRFREEL